MPKNLPNFVSEPVEGSHGGRVQKLVWNLLEGGHHGRVLALNRNTKIKTDLLKNRYFVELKMRTKLIQSLGSYILHIPSVPTSVNGLECVLNLIESTLGAEDCDHMIKTCA